MGEFEAVADAVTGGVLGRAVEPAAGEGDGHSHEAHCLNCGARLSGLYCHECGQQAHVHKTVGAFFHDFAHGVLHFEGKIWRTLPLLVWRPGELTRRYIDGQRASFVSPIALFLFCVFLMFAALSATGNVNPHLGDDRNLASQEKTLSVKITKLERKKASPDADFSDRQDLEEKIGRTKKDLALVRQLRSDGVTEASFSRAREDEFSSELPWLEDAYHKAKQNPDLLIYKLKSNSYKWSWALIPLSVPFVWLLFPFSRRFRMYDHIVFVTYSVGFMMLLVTAGTLVGAAGITAVALPMLLIPPIHMYRQLRGAYSVGWFGALWRTIALVTVAIGVLLMFIVLMVVLGALD